MSPLLNCSSAGPLKHENCSLCQAKGKLVYVMCRLSNRLDELDLEPVQSCCAKISCENITLNDSKATTPKPKPPNSALDAGPIAGIIVVVVVVGVGVVLTAIALVKKEKIQSMWKNF